MTISLLSKAQEMSIVDYSTLEREFIKGGDTLKVVNFWATSCKPCIEEFPFFIDAQETFKNNKVEFIYVSLDFSKQKDRAEQFVTKKGLIGRHFLLKDDPNVWINKIDKDWGGDIPYTLLIPKNGKYIKHDAKFNDSEELKTLINKYLN